MTNAKQEPEAGLAPGLATELARACEERRRQAVRDELALRALFESLDPETWDVFDHATAMYSIPGICERTGLDRPVVVEHLRAAWRAMERMAVQSQGPAREKAWALLESCARVEAFIEVVPEARLKDARLHAVQALFDALLEHAMR